MERNRGEVGAVTDPLDSPDGTPFSEDCVIAGAARLTGMEVIRSTQIIITDRKALDEQGLLRKSPDYSEIRRLLNSGADVRGAELGAVEYILRKRGGKE